ncbi:MAG: AEC family transporter [Cellulosilyticaceae bacterium]
MFVSATQNILSILLILVLGYAITNASWFKNGGPEIVSKLVIKVILPINLFNNIISTYSSRSELIEILKGIPIPFISIAITLLLAFLMSKLFHIKDSQQGTFINMVSLSNTVLIGMPIVQSLLGPEATSYNIIYFMANTIFFWTLGTYLIRRDAGIKCDLFTWANLKQVFSPPFIGFLLGVGVVLFGLPLPSFFLDFTGDMATLSTPLSMIFIGTVIRRIDMKSFKITKEMVLVLLSRFLLAPALMYAICLPLPLPLLMKKVFILLSSMPVMTQASIMAKEYGADYEYTSLMVTVTSISMFIFIPLYSYLFEILPL